jgi:DNA-binding cell septation regulator SpoVG
MYGLSNNLEMNSFKGISVLEEYLSRTSEEFVSLPPLKESAAEYKKVVHPIKEKK